MSEALAVSPGRTTHRGAAGYRISRLVMYDTLTAGQEIQLEFSPYGTMDFFLPPTGRGAVIVTAGNTGGAGSNVAAPVVVRLSKGVYPQRYGPKKSRQGPGSLATDAVFPNMYGWGETHLIMTPAYIPISGPYDDVQVGFTPLPSPQWQAGGPNITLYVALVIEGDTKDGYPLIEGVPIF